MSMRKILLLLVFLGVSAVGWYQWSLRPFDSHSDVRRTVKVASGSSVETIGVLLEEKGIIRSSLVFKIYVKTHDAEIALQAGSFVLRPSMNIAQVVEAL